MSKLTNKKTFAVFAVMIVASIVITYITAVISNRANIVEESIATVMEGDHGSPTTFKMGNVNVKYVDTEGNEIASGDTLTGSIGSEYRAERKIIPTYVPYGAEPFNKAGNYTAEEQNVEFVYEKEDSRVEVSEENNSVTIRTLHSRNTKEYDVKIVTMDENGNLIKTMTYGVKDSEGNTLRKGKVINNNFVVGTLTISDEGKDTYKIEEDSQPYYEKLEDRPIEFSVNKEWNNEKNEYEISLEYDDYEGVTFEVTDSEIIINIVNKVRDIGNIFDLDVKKYVEKVIVKENDSVAKEYIANENGDDLVKVDVAKEKLHSTTLEVTYKIVIQNVGTVPGYATEVVDYLPEGFTYLSGGQWDINGNTATTKELEDVLIDSGDKQELRITVEWKLSDDTIGLKANRVEITDYQNELDLEDKTPDNVDTVDIMATIRTGGAELPVGITLFVLNILAITVYLIKNRKEK